MRVIETVAGIREAMGKEHHTVGLVPTMGYLHEGHLSLVRLARKDNSLVVVSIFVNPTQFGPSEDLASYPRDTERDLRLLEKEGTNLVFAPGAKEMYPPGFSTWVDVEHITERLEGSSRPGHFRGVATVVAKLFNIVQPDRAYFGQKDAQQALVIKKMVAELNMNLEIILGETIRESDGLAMSSRNSYLNPEERQSATVLYKSLSLAKQLWQDGETSADVLRREMRLLIHQEPPADIDYISIADASTLEELETIDRPALASLAVRIGKTRLIDNILLK
jgi:pantoate--beta-alanine ligase